jgi:gamma-butyrobetaine dioxygenase
LWQAADLADAVPSARWDDFANDQEARAACLESLLTVGFTLLRDVPVRDRAVVEVAETFGYVRETNYGQVFEVRVEDNPTNLAFSSLPITPHTDNPYRDPVPTIQLLHCLINAAEGGDSGLVDGFAAAAKLRESSPEDFEILATTPVTFRYVDAGADLAATNPMISRDPLGRIKQIRFNNRSLCPVALPADTGFTASGQRHLQGCYADLDSAASALQTLRRVSL